VTRRTFAYPTEDRAARKGGLSCVYDFEVRSALRLDRTSTFAYAGHWTTSVISLAWQFVGEAEVHDWVPGSNTLELDRLLHAVLDGAEMHSWSPFDPIIWNRVQRDWPPIPLKQQHDIAARAAMCGLPRKLERCAAALGLTMTKDKEGQNAMRYLTQPRSWLPEGTPVFSADPGKLMLMRRYCKQDVHMEYVMHGLLPAMPDSEREVWLHDQRLNGRGFRIDQTFLRTAGPFWVKALHVGNAEMSRVTQGAITSISQTKALGEWLTAQGVDLRVTNGEGLESDPLDDDDDEQKKSRKGQLAKAAVRRLLERPGLPPAAREALEVRADYGRSSAAKILALTSAVSADGRLHGSLVYHAALTGRQSGALFQPQNLPRDSYKPDEWKAVLRDMRRLSLARFIEKHGSPMAALVRLLRGSIIAADEYELNVGDFSSIELRVLAWYADQRNLLTDLRNGAKIYHAMAARIYEVPVVRIVDGTDQYAFGKMVTLGCGYGLGWSSLIRQARDGYQLVIDEPLAHAAIDAYRTTWPKIPLLWRELEDAAFNALAAPGTEFPVCDGCAALKVSRDRTWLGLRLASGRWIRLREPEIIMDDRNGLFEPRPTLSAMGLNLAHQWVRQTFWGGHLTNYLVQGTARDLLVEAALRCEARGWPVVLQVHDEIVCETPVGTVTVEALAAVMNELPDWALGCPIATKTFNTSRYHKD
jgi:DNA polymerase